MDSIRGAQGQPIRWIRRGAGSSHNGESHQYISSLAERQPAAQEREKRASLHDSIRYDGQLVAEKPYSKCTSCGGNAMPTNGPLNRKLRMGLVGGGQGAFIGRVHATA